MKLQEIKGARTRLGYTQQYVADELGISIHSYQKKESGKAPFTDDEKVKMVKILDLTFQQFNDSMYNGELPFASIVKKEGEMPFESVDKVSV